jgi:hypothetical protein
MKQLIYLLTGFILITGLNPAWAQDANNPSAPPAAAVSGAGVSLNGDSVPATLGSQNPSQAEGEKAPAPSRSASVPKFSLPDVVITGENELTIGAKRTGSIENDVTWGAENLSQIDRSTDDMPGLEKSLTALSTQETGPSHDAAFILHGGGGIPAALEGWGLFGENFKDLDLLLAGSYSAWDGQTTGASFDGDQKYRFGGDFKLIPVENTNLRLSIYSTQVSATLPYQNAIQEIHQGLDINAGLSLKWSSLWRTEILFNGKITTLNYWDQTSLANQIQEFNGRIRLFGEEINSFWDAFTLEVGSNQASSDFTLAPNNSYNLTWASAQTRFNLSENFDLTAFVESQSGNGPNMDSKAFPAVSFRWRLLDDTQITAYWKTARAPDGFYDTFMDREHVSALSELPGTTENTGEWGGCLTEKFDENKFLNLRASTAQFKNYYQWTDINPLSPDYIEVYTPVPSVEIDRISADFQWKLDELWKTDWAYQWTQGTNNSGNNLNLTFLPQHQGIVSITRSDDQWNATLSLVAASDRQALDAASLDLPAYATLNVSAAYHVSRGFSLWMKGDNLLGTGYTLEPGYLEPQFYLRGGIEVVF